MSSPSLSAAKPGDRAQNASRVIFASFIGTAIEFYDFYVYATATALVIGPVFFPHGSPAAQALSAFVTFGHRVLCAADRLVSVRPFWRSRRT